MFLVLESGEVIYVLFDMYVIGSERVFFDKVKYFYIYKIYDYFLMYGIVFGGDFGVL